MSQRPVIGDSGSFNCWSQSFEFPSLLLAICDTGRTGEVRFSNQEATKVVVLKEGNIVFARSSSIDDRLGPYLLRQGKIRFEHVTELGRFVTPEKRFGAVLVENGVLKAEELVEGVLGQVRSIVASLFPWTNASFTLEAKQLEKETILLHIPLPRLIVQGVREVKSWRRVGTGIGSLDAVYQTSDGIEDDVQRAKLGESELALISEMRGPKTIAEACASLDIPDFEVCQLLWAFRALGWVTPVGQEIPGQAQDDPDFAELDAVLGTKPLS